MNGRKTISKRIKALIISAVAVILSIPLVVMPVVTVIVYESIFGMRYETEEYMRLSVSDFEGLCVERSDFLSDGVKLAGYKYSKKCHEIKGVAVVSHGLGGGGHNFYMPIIDVLASNGYYVFAYDAHGHDESGGSSAEGLPQGVIDLDNALRHVKATEEYAALPIVLFGHSWGAYSVGNALNLHPDVKAVVIVSGFNESEDMLYYQSKKYVGIFSDITISYVELYERIKFGGDITSMSAISGMKNSDANVMVIHSKDDTTVSCEYGYDLFYEEFGDSERFEFVQFDNRGHTYLLYSDEAERYREEYKGGIIDKKRYFEPDHDLMERIVSMYDRSCA